MTKVQTVTKAADYSVTVYGKGDQTRSFQYVSDLVEGVWRLLPLDFHDPVNLGNPAEVTILEFAEEIRKLAGSTSEIVFRPLPQDDPKVRQPDITRARTLLGWEPKVALEEGLSRTMEWCRAHYHCGASHTAAEPIAKNSISVLPAVKSSAERLTFGVRKPLCRFTVGSGWLKYGE